MDTAALDALLCPICGLNFTHPQSGATAVACANGHSFDIARQGYLNLLTGHGTKFIPDTPAMTAARDDFLDAGHYAALAAALADKVLDALHSEAGSDPALIIDAGTGTGYYLQKIMATIAASGTVPRSAAAVGMDISKFALRRAARRNPDAINIVWDLWRELPLGANTADVVLVVFAPRNAREFARILKPGGILLVVTPLPGHLAEIAEDAGMLGIQAGKESALNDSLGDDFALLDTDEVKVQLQLSIHDVANAALMGPAGHHLDPAVLREQLAQRPAVTAATAGFRISTFQRR